MEIFNAIGLDILKGKTLNDLAEDAEKFGEASLSMRGGGVIHGRCWRIGGGLEVWAIHYESAIGEISYADCRPGFRARFAQKINSWSLFEDEEGEATLEGFTGNPAVRVFFQLQNLTEIQAVNFERKSLNVGLCGLARRAAVSAPGEKFHWKPLAEISRASKAEQTDWSLCGRVLNFKLLCNPHSGENLYWIHLDLGDLALEVLVNRRTLRGASRLRVGAMIKADIWLQGHIANQSTLHSKYEGVDWSKGSAAFWKNLRKLN
jgi:hypothetical protein